MKHGSRRASTDGPDFRAANNPAAERRRKQPDARQHRLKPEFRTARARVVAAELLKQLDVAMHDSQPALDLRLGREALTPLAGDFERAAGRRCPSRVPSWPPVVRGGLPMHPGPIGVKVQSRHAP